MFQALRKMPSCGLLSLVTGPFRASEEHREIRKFREWQRTQMPNGRGDIRLSCPITSLLTHSKHLATLPISMTLDLVEWNCSPDPAESLNETEETGWREAAIISRL